MKNNEVKNVNEMTIKELGEITSISEGTLRVWISKVNVGDVYVENYVNNKLVRTNLIKKFGEEEINRLLGFDVNELVIIKGVKVSNVYVDVEDLEIGKKYIVKNYGFNKVRILFDIIESNDKTFYIWYGVDKKEQDVYEINDVDKLYKESFKFVEY